MSIITSVGGWSLLGAIGLLLTSCCLTWWKYPSAPGPMLGRFTDLWQAFTMATGSYEKQNVRLHREHGKIVRVGPKSYSIDDADAAKIIYGHGTRFIKSEWYLAWQIPKHFLEVNLFGQRDIKQHANARRRYANLYSMSAIVEYEAHVENCVQVFTEILNTCALKEATVDLAKLFQYYAFDVIGEITYSKRFGFMESARDVGNIISTIATILEASQIMGLFPSLVSVQPLLASVGGGEKGFQQIMNFAEERIKEAKKDAFHGTSEHGHGRRVAPDFCSKLLALIDSGDGKNTSQVESDMLVLGACTSNVFAGSDTTSISLNATLFNIITRPDVLQKLRSELDAAAGRGELSIIPKFAEVQQLPYLQAVLKEALRVHPATGLPLWREVPEGGVTLCGTWFPAGTNVGINSWVAHRNVDVWGTDADKFRPERWIESTEEQLKCMNAMFMPFGMGSRTCIGKNISLLEISKLIPYLVRNFDMSVVFANGEQRELQSRCAWFVKQKEFFVTVRSRSTG